MDASRALRNPLWKDLPAVFSEPRWANLPDAGGDCVEGFLDAFSRVFLAHGRRSSDASSRLGRHDPLPGLRTLEERIIALPTLASPKGKPPEFLDWLGGWVALSRRVELTPHRKQEFIAEALRLYAIRGTRAYLERLLAIYQFPGAVVDEPELPSIQIGHTSTVGRDTMLGGSPAHFFRVTVTFARAGGGEYGRLVSLARAIIDLAKPAHTWYELRIVAPAMEIGKHSTVGVDTLLPAGPSGRKD